MGVPGFFSWLLHKSNCVNNILLPNIDNKPNVLFLDANGIFHPVCAKVIENEKYIGLKNKAKLESIMIQNIIEHIEIIIRHVEPTDEVYISVDGPAPYAKINQQRKRRYKSVYETNIKSQLKDKYNIKYNNWSSICITPGTEFMEKLNMAIMNHNFVSNMNIKITYSSYHVVGEGEHKIFNYIKRHNSDENKTYVIYGLDADLIFLSLASNVRNIYLLREKLNFTYNFEKHIEKYNSDYIYVSIDNTGDCIYNLINIESLNKTCIINDFMLICFLLGNDFLPHVPSIEIKNKGIEHLVSAYIATLKEDETYLVCISCNELDIGKINEISFRKFISKLADKECTYFVENYNKRKYNRPCPFADSCNNIQMYNRDLWHIENLKNIDNTDPIELGKDNQTIWKYKYYNHYYNTTMDTYTNVVNKLCSSYLKGLQWTLKYYLHGCINWTWYYEYINAPFVSDLHNYMSQRSNSFHVPNVPMTKVLKPSVQLLHVIPPQHSYLLPKSYKFIANYFPREIELDYVGKDMLWKCSPILPTINGQELNKVIKPLRLTEDEKKRDLFENDISLRIKY